ncbi:MAG: PilZ domain-containing protein [Thermodesulfobacteriota bacterium]
MLQIQSQPVPQFSRLGLRAYSLRHMVELSFGEKLFLATLVTISNYGARLKAPGRSLGLVMGDRAFFNLVVPEKGLQAGRIPCRVTWVDDGEVEVGFAALLEMAVGEIQVVVDC